MKTCIARHLVACVGSALATLAMPAAAANYALIMTIGSYADPAANLPGVDLDAQMARAIAAKMGVPEGNIQAASNQALTRQGIANQLTELNKRVQPGDNVMLYYSGHGGQRDGGGGKCVEGLIAHDLDYFYDSDLTANLNAIAQKAGQLVMLNDSCFSGGVARSDKSATRSVGGNVPKNWVDKLSTPAAGRQCGQPINKTWRNLVPEARKQGANMLYIAAAADNEVAHATPRGSAATLAWFSCLNAGSDTNSSGMLSGEEVRVCAQHFLEQNGHTHHITLVGNQALPVSFAGYSGSGMASDGGSQAIDPVRGLEDIRAAASPKINVKLQASRPSLRIGQDELAMTVSTSESGYLSIFHVGSDGKTFDLLFPNNIDTNNYLNAGATVSLPRPSWRVKAGGPVGASRLMAVVSATPMSPRTSAKFMKSMPQLGNSPFHAASATSETMRKLYVEATGVNDNDPQPNANQTYGAGSRAPSGRFGASDIISIQEY